MLTTAIEAAREAGTLLREGVGKIKTIERKQGEATNLVTEFDKRAEALIISHIRSRFPSHDILAEESGSHDIRSDYRWVIDPLDGTTNYTHGLPLFSVSIGIEHHGEMVAGVIYDPSADELFTAEKGKGAFLNGTPLHVSNADTLINSLLVTGFPYTYRQNPGRIVDHFQNFLLEAQGIRRLGSAALDLAYIAAGRLDGYWEVTLNPWDKAAGVLLVKEAGGTVTDFLGNPDSIYTPTTLASNGIIHRQMIDVLKKAL
ncbi:MAG: inositol monophosphatase family protein [Acidobacteriota bacterium]